MIGIPPVMQALSGLNFDKFKEAVKGYTFYMTKPPKNDDAFQQVQSLSTPLTLLLQMLALVFHVCSPS
jgi:hypothetical protein